MNQPIRQIRQAHRKQAQGERGFAPLILIIIGAIVVAVGGGFFYYQQSTDINKEYTDAASSAPGTQVNDKPIPGTQPISKPSSAKTSSAERNDLGCWPSSCSVIPDAQGKKSCEDWKAGRPVQWPSCSYFSNQLACQQLCIAETKTPGSVPPTSVPPTTTAPVSTACSLVPLTRQFKDAPYYTGPLFDGHFHMPQFFKIADHPEAPVIDQDISRKDVACLFSDKSRVKGAFAFYGIPEHLKSTALGIAQNIEKLYPGSLTHFLEFVVFPGYSVDPVKIKGILDSNKGLFKGYGELSMYLPHYSGVKPGDTAMRELYGVADTHNLIVMMHPIEGQHQAIEEAMRDYPNVQFLFHAAERLSSANMFLDTFMGKYPNAHYSVDIMLFGDDSNGRPLLDAAKSKQDFITKFKQSWQSTLSSTVATWKSRIEKHPDQYLWGTDRGASLWNYDQEIMALLEEYSRAFIGQLDPAVQEKYAYKNAESLLQNR
ncbi:MAG: Uncharacterized protein G01um10143_511 [Parcubacteria group bacterium Gr01-1014_3]|nr:MAG: Uncharacterized protein G01um10143_511 [Parcubacteria group bacterium Gr01-1014_3]